MASAPTSDARPPTWLEALLRYERASALVLLILVPVVSWTWIVVMARDMYGSMSGASAWMMTRQWDIPHVSLLWAMWAVMMTAMMLPSAAPTLLLYGVMVRRSMPEGARGQVYALSVGYLAAWIVFSLGATGLQRLLARLLFISPMMEATTPVFGAVLLLVAGVYQLTPIKHACLQTCRSPLGFLMGHWRAGIAGALRMGLEHGAYCVGCCWALMLLLFVGGVMNLVVIAALTAFVAFEKLAPFGATSARVSGVLLMATGLWMLVT